MNKKKISILLFVSVLFLNIILSINFPIDTEKNYFHNNPIEKDIIHIKQASGQSVCPTEIGNFSDGGYLEDVFVSGDIAYVADRHQGLEIINVSDPYNPSLLGKYDDDKVFQTARAIYVSNDIAYIAEGYDGLNIVDVSDPTNPTLLSKFANQSFPNTEYEYWDVKVSGGVAYATIFNANGYDNYYGGLDIINVSDPTNPTLLGKFGDVYNSSKDVFLYGTIAYIADDGLEIIDVSDPVNPIELGQYVPYAGYSSALCVSESIVYLAAGTNGIDIIDVSDPHNPIKLGGFDDGGDSWDIDIFDGIAYVSDGNGGFEIIDVSDPQNPAKLGEFNDGGDVVNAFILGGIAYLADKYEGLKIIDIGFECGEWLTPTEIGSFKNEGFSTGVFVSGDYAYLADAWYGLDIINVENLTNPSLLGHFSSSNPEDLFVSGDVVYLADWYDGLLIINVSSKTNPQLLGTYNNAFFNATDVYVSGNIAYVVNLPHGFHLIDISNPNNPRQVGHYDTLSAAHGIYVSGNIAYVACTVTGLRIYDISNPGDIKYLGNYNDYVGTAYDVYVSGDIAYIADREGGLEIIDVSNPTNPTKIGEFNNFGLVEDVYVSGNIAYVADVNYGVEIIDVTDPSNPFQITTFYNEIMNPYGLTLSGNIAYVAGGSIDLEIIDTGYDGDDDGLSNVQELLTYSTNLCDNDTDNDELLDGYEVNTYNTDPKNPDSDYDTILDGEEVVLGLDGYITDPNDHDSDNDLMPDGWEVNNTLNPTFDDAMADADSDNLSNVDEYFSNTDPNDNDSDNDVMLDGWEVLYGLNPLIDDASGDEDSDNLTNLQEYEWNTDPFDLDSDNDTLYDGDEVYIYSTDPSKYDTDGDGYSDGKEIEAGTDPLNPKDYPKNPFEDSLFFIILIVIIISISGSISLVFYLRMKGVIGGRPGINIFISHKIDEFEKYKIEQLARYLEKNKEISKVFFSEKEIHGDIDDWMEKNVPLCQVLMYVATKKSLKSEGCHHEIQVALENDLEILPIVGEDIELSDLKQLNDLQLDLEKKRIDFKDLNLHRKIALNYLPDFEEFYQNLTNIVNKFIEPLNKVLLKLKESPVSNINLLEKKLGYDEDEIIKLIKILLKVHKIKGALTADHLQFLNKKEVIRRIDLTKEQGRYEDINELIIDAGIDKESIDDVKMLLGKHYAQKIKVISG